MWDDWVMETVSVRGRETVITNYCTCDERCFSSGDNVSILDCWSSSLDVAQGVNDAHPSRWFPSCALLTRRTVVAVLPSSGRCPTSTRPRSASPRSSERTSLAPLMRSPQPLGATICTPCFVRCARALRASVIIQLSAVTIASPSPIANHQRLPHHHPSPQHSPLPHHHRNPQASAISHPRTITS